MKAPLVVRGLGVVYLEGTPFIARALDDVDLTVEPGEIVGLVGGTGSGKSTLVQTIMGLVPPTSGTVEYPEGFDASRLFERVGLVFQQPEDQLFERTVAEDVGFGPAQLGCDEAEIRRRVGRALAAVGLDLRRYTDRNPLELSGGEKRRVAIAGILSMEPELLILDEPTAGLDQAGRDALLASIRELHAKRKLTLVVIGHDMELMGSLATRLVVMREGRIAAQGTPAQIFGDTDGLDRCGLRPPAAAEVVARLRRMGIDVPGTGFDPVDVGRRIVRALGR